MRRQRLIFLFLPILLAAAALAMAQDPPPCDRAPFEVLRPMIGNWEVHGRERVADGEFEATTGVSTIRVGTGGCALIENRSGSRGSTPFLIANMFLVTPQGGLELRRLDAVFGPLPILAGRAAGDTLFFEGVADTSEHVLRRRAVYVRASPDSFALEHRVLPREGAAWQTTGSAVYRRMK